MIETLLELWLLSADLHFSIQVHPLVYDHVLIILNHWEIGMEMLLLSKKNGSGNMINILHAKYSSKLLCISVRLILFSLIVYWDRVPVLEFS